MPVWRIELLGGLSVKRDDRVITRFRTHKTGALLAYLAFYRQRTHSREVLADLFWGEYNLEDARNSLSKAISSLRQQLEPPGIPRNSIMAAGRFTLQLNPENVITDVAEFEEAAGAAQRAGSPLEQVQLLMKAVDLYQGSLLPGYYDEWIMSEQAPLEQTYFQSARQLVNSLEQAGDLTAALRYAQQATRVDPLREEMHLMLMRLYVASGQPSQALHQYTHLEKILEEQAGEEPSEAAHELRDWIRSQPSGTLTQVASDEPDELFSTKKPRPVPLETAAQGGTLTYLIIDLAGDPQEKLRQAWANSLGLLREMFRRHRGMERPSGSGYYVVSFGRAQDALTCAVACQDALAAKGANELPGQVRIALHTGDTASHEETDPVLPVVKRMVLAAHGGQIVCSEETAVLLRRDMEPGIQLFDLGLYRLHESSTPDRLFHIIYPDMPVSEFPPLQATPVHTGNLPLQMTRFFGRENEIGQLAACLKAQVQEGGEPVSGGRLLTLTGPGGTGKTRLSIEAGRRVLEDFSGRVWFVSLQEISNPAEIPETVRDALGLPRLAGVKTFDQIVGFLGDKPCLLILDNMEQLLPEGADQVKELLDKVPVLQCMASSRRRLGLQGEQDFPVHPLPVPTTGSGKWGVGSGESDSDKSEFLKQLQAFPSVQLFVDRAQAVVPDFQLTAGNAEGITSICGRLEGLPLAIELAAARVGVLSVSQILERLTKRLDLLVSRQRDRNTRHRTLREAIEWSYDLLSPELRRFFVGLSVFHGGWTLEAAEAVLDEPLALDYLSDLRECSLVQAAPGEHGMRFSMLETLREYALEGLQVDEQQDEYHRKHAEYYLALAQEADGCHSIPQEKEQYDRLQIEYENLRAALEWSIVSDELLSFKIIQAIWRFWDVRSHWTEARKWIDRALTFDSEVPTELMVDVLIAGGYFALRQGAYDVAIEHLQRSIGISTSLNKDEGAALALSYLGSTYREQSQYQQAQDALERSLSLYRKIGHQAGIADVLAGLSAIADAVSKHKDAVAYAQQSLELMRELNNRQGIARLLNTLGRSLQRWGDYATAEKYLLESLQINRELNNRYLEAHNLVNLGIITLMQNDHEKANQYFSEGLAIYRDLGDRNGIAGTLNNLGNIKRKFGQYEVAQDLYEQALQINRTIGNRAWELINLNNMGQVAALRGDLESADQFCRASLRIADEIGDRRGVGYILYHMGLIASERNDNETALQLQSEGLHIAHELGVKQHIALGLEGIAIALCHKKEFVRAARLIGAAAHLREEIGAAIPSDERYYYQCQSTLVSSIGDEAYQTAFEEGKQTGWEQVVAEALALETKAIPH